MSEPKFDLEFFATERARKAREFQTRHVSRFVSPAQLALLLIGIIFIGGGAYSELPQRAFSTLRDQVAAISFPFSEESAPTVAQDSFPKQESAKKAPVPAPAPKKVALATTPAPAEISNPGAERTTIVNNYPIERTIERILVADPALLAGYVTQAHLNSQLESIRSNIGAQLYGPTFPLPATTPTNAGITGTVAMMGRIEHLEEVELVSPTITNARISGISGLTDADIPDSLTLSSLTVSEDSVNEIGRAHV